MENKASTVVVQGCAGGWRARVHTCTPLPPTYWFLTVWCGAIAAIRACVRAREVIEQARTKGAAVHMQTAGRMFIPPSYMFGHNLALERVKKERDIRLHGGLSGSRLGGAIGRARRLGSSRRLRAGRGSIKL